MTLNVIHLPHDNPGSPRHRQERWDNLMKELSHQKINDYKIWDGIKMIPTKTGISRAHKQIIKYAKENNLEQVCVAEDDICFYGSGAWEYFLTNVPNNFDLFLGGYYGGKPDENNVMNRFDSLTLYVCHSRFYDTFLSVPENLHLDGALSLSGGKIVACNPMVCHQMENNFSEQRGRYANDSIRLKGKSIYNG
jgi:hypothetical protein